MTFNQSIDKFLNIQKKNLKHNQEIPILSTKMSKQALQDAVIEQYHQFLSDLGHAICDKVTNDEGVQALKEMEDKEYLLERIKEIVEAVNEIRSQETVVKYVQQIQQQKLYIGELENAINKLQKQGNFGHINQVHNNTPQTQQAKMPELSQQNIQLQKRLICQQQEQKLRMRQFAQTIKIMQQQQQSLRKKFSTQLESAIEGIKMWEQKYRQVYQQKSALELSLEQEVQRILEMQLKQKQLAHRNQELDMLIQNERRMNKTLKQQASANEDRLIGLEKKKQTLEQQIKTQGFQIQLLKKLTNQLRAQQSQQLERNVLSSQSTSQKPSQLIQNLKKIEQEQQQSDSLQKQRKILELEKRIEKLKSQKHDLERQYHEYRLNQEKIRFDIEQQLNEVKINRQKQLRVQKQEFMKEKQASTQIYQSKIKSINQQNEGKLKQQQCRIQQLIKITDEKSAKSKTQLKDYQNLLRQKQLSNSSTISQLQRKNEQLRSYIRQLQKSLKNSTQSSNDYINEFKLRVETSEQQVQKYKRQTQKQRRQLQLVEKQLQAVRLELKLKQSNELSKRSQQKLEKYEKQDYEQHIRQLSQLKQQLLIKESQLKYTKKQLNQKIELIDELKLNNQKLQDKKDNLRTLLNKTQKEIAQLRRQMVERQQYSKKQAEELQRRRQSRVQEQKKQLTSYYEDLLRSRQEKIQQHRNNSQHLQQQLIIKNLRQSMQTLKQQKIKLQQKIQSMAQEAKNLKTELRTKETQLQEKKEEVSNLVKQLIMEKEGRSENDRKVRQKFRLNQLVFKEFKMEIDAYIRKQLTEVRQIGREVIKMINQMGLFITEFKEKLSLEFYSKITAYESQMQQSMDSLRSHYEHQITITHKINLQQLQQSYSQQVKQLKVQHMSQIASRQFDLKNLSKQLSHSQQSNIKLTQQLNSLNQQYLSLKQTFTTIKQANTTTTDKIVKTEKILIEKERDISVLVQQNQQLKGQLAQLEHSYQEKLDKCREKYVQENEKLFNKYEKEFDKLITMNTKVKNTTLSTMMLGSVVPTREMQSTKFNQPQMFKTLAHKSPSHMNISKQVNSQKKQSKLDNLKKQILIQKKKLQVLDSTKSKIPVKGTSASTSNLKKNFKLCD